MKLTDPASKAILEVMKKRKLDPKKFVFEFFRLENGGVGIGFAKDRHGTAFQYGDLTVMVGHNVDLGDITVDFGEVNGRNGLIFLENK